MGNFKDALIYLEWLNDNVIVTISESKSGKIEKGENIKVRKWMTELNDSYNNQCEFEIII